MNTIGYEIEFVIPPEQLEKYSLLYHNPEVDNYGFDVFNMHVAEYRSDVFTTNNDVYKDYMKFKKTIKEYNPEFPSKKDGFTYGIHISFGSYSKLRLMILFMIIFFTKHPLICLERMLRVEWFRQHPERLEFRLIPTLPDDTLFLKFLITLQGTFL